VASHCPHCKAPLSIKTDKPGKYAARCGKCGERFAVVIAEDAVKTMALPSAPSRSGPSAVASGSPEKRASEAARAPDKQKTTPIAPAGAPAGPTADSAPTVVLPPKKGSSVPQAPPRPTSKHPAAARPSRHGNVQIPGRLGGYEIIREIGRGGMGVVLLARQVSLDRNVALKVMSDRLARHALFLARFTREAYAAAHLVHPNVVQIYDMGADRDTYYFSMEFVRGQTLGDLIEDGERLDPEVASGYILQAARGLSFAHQQGMIHRDVKPSNLMLDEQGIVKVADLGLVKTPALKEGGRAGDRERVKLLGSPELTGVGDTMGSPAYMAPEQAKDAASVDARADIYSLGCTFYALVTGRPVFEGKTAKEVITKHAMAKVVAPDMIVRNLPKQLSRIITKMVAKRPEDRYQNMEEVVRQLGEFLGTESARPMTPREDEALLLEKSAATYNRCVAGRIRLGAIWGFGLLCAAFAIVFGMLHHPFLASAVVGLGVLSWGWYFVIAGFTQRTSVFLRLRQIVFTNRPVDWLIWLFLLLLGGSILWSFDLLWAWLIASAAAAGVAAGFHLVVDRLVARERKGPVEAVRYLLKKLRLRGLDEQAVRKFVCNYGADRWEPFYEALFGYDAKIEARRLWGIGENGRPRKRSGRWRDVLVRWMESTLKARKMARDKRHLQALEARALKAQGVSEAEARDKALLAAEEMVAHAETLQAAASAGAGPRRAADMTGRRARRSVAGRQTLDLLLGARARFLLGAVLLVACALWMKQNNIIGFSRIEAAAKAQGAMVTQTIEEARSGQDGGGEAESPRPPEQAARPKTSPLRFPLLPESVARRFFNSYKPGAAGLILVVSVLFMGWRIGLLVIPAAGVVMAGPELGLRSVGPLGPEQMSLAIAAGLIVVALLFCRERGARK